jgi:hypothetical protein
MSVTVLALTFTDTNCTGKVGKLLATGTEGSTSVGGFATARDKVPQGRDDTRPTAPVIHKAVTVDAIFNLLMSILFLTPCEIA